MKSSVKKMISVLLTVAMVALLFAACGGPGTPESSEPYRAKEKEEIFTKTIHDFGDLRVDNLDDQEHTNFVVYAEGVQEITVTESTNVLVETDYENLSYTFTNADETLKSMKKGDVFFGSVSELCPDGVTAKVKDIQISGDKVTVYSEEIGLADLFEYVDVCMEVPLSRAIVEGEGDEGTEVALGAQAAAQEGAFVHNLSTVKQEAGIGLKAALTYEQAHYTLTGEVASTVTYVTLEFRFSREEMRLYTGIWADVENSQTLRFEAERVFEGSKRLARVEIPVYGILKLYLTPSVIWSGSGSMAGNITSTCTEQKGFTATVDAQGIQAEKIDRITKPLTTDGTMEEMEGELSVGLELNAALGIGFVGNVYVAVRSGVTVAAELCPEETAKPEEEPDSIHACEVCFDGDVFGWVEISYGMKIRLISLMENLDIGNDIIDFLKESGLTRILDEKPLWQNRWNVADFYISIREEGPDFGWGECDNFAYRTRIAVVESGSDEEIGVPSDSIAAGAVVTAEAIVPRENGEYSILTETAVADENGVAVMYLPPSSVTAAAEIDGYSGTSSFAVGTFPSEQTIELFEDIVAEKELVVAYEHDGYVIGGGSNLFDEMEYAASRYGALYDTVVQHYDEWVITFPGGPTYLTPGSYYLLLIRYDYSSETISYRAILYQSGPDERLNDVVGDWSDISPTTLTTEIFPIIDAGLASPE